MLFEPHRLNHVNQLSRWLMFMGETTVELMVVVNEPCLVLGGIFSNQLGFGFVCVFDSRSGRAHHAKLERVYADPAPYIPELYSLK